MEIKDKIQILVEELCNNPTYQELRRILIDAVNNNEYKRDFLVNGEQLCPYMDCTDKSLNNCDDEIFMYWRPTIKRTEWYYYVSNMGRVLLLNKKNIPEYKIDEQDKYYIIPLCKGKINCDQEECYLYLDKDRFKKMNPDFDKELILNSSTPVHEMVAEAFQINKNNDEHIKYEIHHINNCGFDNRVENLVSLRKSIHAMAHEFK